MKMWLLERSRNLLSMDAKQKPTSGKTGSELKWSMNRSDILGWGDGGGSGDSAISHSG